MKLAEKFKEKPDICNAIGAHHDESGNDQPAGPHRTSMRCHFRSTPGSTPRNCRSYIKRLNDLEQLAMSYPGVTKTYAIQAGRELRVIVGADKIDDKQTENLSGEIAKKIQDEMTYPGQVKITSFVKHVRLVSLNKETIQKKIHIRAKKFALFSIRLWKSIKLRFVRIQWKAAWLHRKVVPTGWNYVPEYRKAGQPLPMVK